MIENTIVCWQISDQVSNSNKSINGITNFRQRKIIFRETWIYIFVLAKQLTLLKTDKIT